MSTFLRTRRLAFAALMLLGSAAAPAVAHQARAAEVGSQTQTADPYVFHPVSIMGGGFITGIVAHPTAPGVMYARTDIGSSYRWDPTANQWVPLTDFNSAANYNYQGTESIALDPTDPNRLYLAQGMYTSGSAAMFVSTDRGAHFAIYPTPFRMGANNLGRNLGERLAVNPLSPNELYMGTRSNGLYRSEDHAQTWTQVVNFPITSSSDGIGIVFVIFNPSHPDTIYVGANSPNGLYETTDGGATWQSIPGQPARWNPDTLVSGHPPQSTAPKPMRAALGSNGNLYVTYGDSPGPYGVQYGAVYRYDTASGASTDITPGSNNSTPPPFSPQAWPPGGFCAISVDQNDPKTLVVVSLDRDPGPAIDSMYLSHDGGATWKDVSQLSSPAGTGGFWGHPISEATTKDGVAVPWLSFNWAPDTYGYGAPSPVAGTVKFGWWIAAALIDPANPDHLLYGTGATIYATDDLSALDSDRAPTWYVQAQGIEETSALSLISPTSGAHLLSGVGDINGFRHDDLTVPQPMFSDPVFITVNSLDWAGQNSNFVVRVGQNQAVFPGACGLGAYSTDQGTMWTKFPSCVPNATTSSGSGGSIAVDASGRYMVWTAPSGSGGPLSSADRGATWVAPTGLSSRIAVTSDKVQAATFYAFRSGTWYTSTDGGVSYTATPASTTGLPNASATPVVSFAAAGDVWLPLGSNGLWHSTDFGIHWTRVGSAGLVAGRFTLGKAAPGASSPALYLWGAAAGVAPLNVTGLYRSDDGGASWVRINDDAHQYGGPAVIQADPRVYGRVYLGMNGRGIVYGDPAALAHPVTIASIDGTTGSNGWYTSEVTLTLSATDDYSDVTKTEYRVGDGGWTTYAAPVRFGDGVRTVEYRSVDKAGNVEDAHSIQLDVDTVAPTSTAHTPAPAPDGWYYAAVPVVLSASDATSGVATLEYALDNGAWTAYAGQPVAVGNGTHQLRYRATDNAGNVETAKALTLNVATCTTTVTGLHNGPLTAIGVVCLTGATINGPISVRDGAVLIATGSSIRGPVFASGALRVTLVDDNVHGPVSVSGTTGGVTIIGTVVTGPVSLTDNKGTVVVSTNTINGPLFCTGNSPAPTDNGTANTVHGPAAGQCAGL